MPWVVVVSPRGDVVELDERFDEFGDAGSLFQMTRLTGRLSPPAMWDDSRVSVSGRHVAMAWRRPSRRARAMAALWHG